MYLLIRGRERRTINDVPSSAAQKFNLKPNISDLRRKSLYVGGNPRRPASYFRYLFVVLRPASIISLDLLSRHILGCTFESVTLGGTDNGGNKD